MLGISMLFYLTAPQVQSHVDEKALWDARYYYNLGYYRSYGEHSAFVAVMQNGQPMVIQVR